IDSDSDFNPGAYVPEPPKKRKKGSAGTSTSWQKGKRSSVLETRASAPKRQKVQRRVDSQEPNPLLEYFAEENLDLCSESEGSDDEPDDMRDEREDEDEGDEEDDDDDEPEASKTFFGFNGCANKPPPKSSPPPVKKREVDEGSATGEYRIHNHLPYAQLFFL
ncbi:hypothetical protein C0991_006741, partial [Blastosporella zonata]